MLPAGAPGGQCSDLTAAPVPAGKDSTWAQGGQRFSQIAGLQGLGDTLAPVPSPSFTASRAPPCPCLHPREGPAAACKSSHGAAARASPGGGRCSRASRRFPLPLKSLLGASSPGERGGMSTQACGGNITNGLHRIKGQCGLLELRPMHWKVTSSVPSQGMCPDCRFGPQLGCAGRGTPLNGLFSSQFPPWGHSAAPEQEEERSHGQPSGLSGRQTRRLGGRAGCHAFLVPRPPSAWRRVSWRARVEG